jgi:hypothetical protein
LTVFLLLLLALVGRHRIGGRARDTDRGATLRLLAGVGFLFGLLRADRALRRIGLGVGLGRIEVHVGRDAHRRAMRAEGRVEHPLDVLLQVCFVVLLGDQLVLGELERARRAAAFRRQAVSFGCRRDQDVSVLIDDGDVFRLEAVDGTGDELRDAADFARREFHAGLGLDRDRCGRRLLGRRVEGRLRRRDMDAGGCDRRQSGDRALQFPFGRALLVDLFLEIGHAEVRLVEEFPTGASALDDAVAR